MYVDKTYYKDTYKGKLIDDDSIEKALQEASDEVDMLTYNRIRGIGFDKLTAYQQEQIKKAVCAHADFVAQYGEYINMPLSGYSAGDVSMSLNQSSIRTQNGVNTSAKVYGYLAQTGLTSRRL